MRFLALLVVTVLVGCNDDIDPPWELDHDRIVAARATPPGLTAAGETSTLDALLAAKGGSLSVSPPVAAQVIAPMSLAGALAQDSGAWVVTMPSEAQLAAARTELGLAAGAPVPLQVGIGYLVNGTELAALKIVWLGKALTNPTLEELTVDGAPLDSMAELVVQRLVDVRFSVAAIQEDDVNWLTDVGEMHDFDLPQSYLRVEKDEKDDPEMPMGDFAVVKRDVEGGVAWRVWPIRLVE